MEHSNISNKSGTGSQLIIFSIDSHYASSAGIAVTLHYGPLIIPYAMNSIVVAIAWPIKT